MATHISSSLVKQERMSPLAEPLSGPIPEELPSSFPDSLDTDSHSESTRKRSIDGSPVGKSVYATPANSNTHPSSFTFMQKSTPVATSPVQSITTAAASHSGSNGDKKPSTPVIRSSWVWNHFVQTPENPFRVQCQFPMTSEDGPEGICGVVLTRDKTGSTGSMCRHLSRVHQILPSSNSSTVNASRAVSKSRKSGVSAESLPAATVAVDGSSEGESNKRTFTAMNGAAGNSANKRQDTQDVKPAIKRNNVSIKKVAPARTLTKEQLISRTIPYFIQSGLCLDRTQYSQFRDFAASLDVQFPPEMQSYNSLLELASRWHNEMKAGIKQELAELTGQISLSCGIWKPFDNCGYFDNKRRDRLFVVVGHFVDNDWRLKRVLLRIAPLRWYQESVVKLVQSVVDDFELKDKVYTVLTDGTAAQGHKLPDMYKGLAKAMNFNSGDPSRIFESLVTDIYFHIDQFLYNDGGSEGSPLLDIVKGIERIADDIESSSSKTEYFQKCQTPREDGQQQPVLVSLRQPSDDDLYSKNVSNQTGWRLFFQLISNAMARKDSLQKYLKKYDVNDSGDADDEEDSDESILQLAEGRFGGKEWAGLGVLYEILRPIYTTLNDLEASAYNTAGVTSFAVESMIKAVKEAYKSKPMREYMYLFGKDEHSGEDNEAVRTFVERIGSIYNDSIKKNGMFKCVQVLDPNFKRLFRHMSREEQAEIRDKFKSEIEKLNAVAVRDEEAEAGEIGDGEEEEKATEAVAGNGDAIDGNGAAGEEFDLADDAEPGIHRSDSIASTEASAAAATTTTTTTRSMRRSEVESGGILDLALESVPSLGGDASHHYNSTTNGSSSSSGSVDRTPGFFQSLVNNEELLDPLTFELDEYVRVSTGVRLVDPYQWWVKNGSSFPQIGRLARTYMAVPGWNDVLHDGKLMEESVVLLRARNGNQGKSLGKEMCLRWWLKNGYGSYCMI